MENKIQELTDKIYKEGVEKGNAEAVRIVNEATQKADKIIQDAEQKAKEILLAAQKQSAELSEKTKSELQLFGKQAVNALKSEITTLLSDKILKTDVHQFLNNKELLNQFILNIAKQWAPQENIVISTEDASTLKLFFAAQAKDLLDKGIEISEVHGTKALFSISPADGSYKVNFGEEEFENYFQSFLRPQLLQLLFDKDK